MVDLTKGVTVPDRDNNMVYKRLKRFIRLQNIILDRVKEIANEERVTQIKQI